MRNFVITIIVGFAIVLWAFFFLPRGEESSKSKLTPKVQFDTKAPSIRAKQKSSGKEKQKAEDLPLQPGKGKAYYASKKMSAEWIFKKDMGGGTLKAYYETGILWLEAEFIEGQLEGKLRTFYPNGNLWTEENFKEGQRHGDMKIFYESGSPWVEYHAARGVMVESPKIYSETGKTVERGVLIKPQITEKSAYFKAYDASGKLINQWDGANEEGMSSSKAYYQNGTLSAEVAFKDKVDEILDGLIKIFYPSGQMWLEASYREGKWRAITKTCYPDGNPWMEIMHPGEGFQALTQIYYPSGSIWLKLDHQPGAKMMPELFSEIVVTAELAEKETGQKNNGKDQHSF